MPGLATGINDPTGVYCRLYASSPVRNQTYIVIKAHARSDPLAYRVSLLRSHHDSNRNSYVSREFSSTEYTLLLDCLLMIRDPLNILSPTRDTLVTPASCIHAPLLLCQTSPFWDTSGSEVYLAALSAPCLEAVAEDGPIHSFFTQNRIIESFSTCGSFLKFCNHTHP